MKVQPIFANRSSEVTRKQMLDHAPNVDGVFEKYTGSTAGELVSNISQAPTYTPVTRGCVIGGGLTGAAGAVAVVCALTGPNGLGLAAAGIAGIALGAAAIWGGVKLEGQLEERNKALQGSVVEAANTTAAALVTTQDGQITDHLFFDHGAFSNPVEVRQEGTGQVLSREVTITGPKPATLKEDTANQEVTLTVNGQETRFPGHLELPTAESRVAALVHQNGDSNPEALQDTRIEFNQEGQARLGAQSKWFWDDVGFSYLNTAWLGQGTTQLNEDGSAYLRGGFDPNVYALQPPAGLLDQPVNGSSSRVTLGHLSDNLRLVYGASHGDLNGVALQPVTLSERPVGATLRAATIEWKDGVVETRHGDQVRRFQGTLDEKGELAVATENGELRQDLRSDHLSLELKHPGGSQISIYQSSNGVSCYQLGDYTRRPEATLTPEGNFVVTWDGGTMNVEVPVPFSWM